MGKRERKTVRQREAETATETKKKNMTSRKISRKLRLRNQELII